MHDLLALHVPDLGRLEILLVLPELLASFHKQHAWSGRCLRIGFDVVLMLDCLAVLSEGSLGRSLGTGNL